MRNFKLFDYSTSFLFFQTRPNISSYEQFEDINCVFLVGRIGSGKTSILNKLKYSIEQGKCSAYTSVAMIDTRDYIAQLGKVIRLSGYGELNYTEIEYTARIEWDKTLNTVAMKALYDKYASAIQKNSSLSRHI